MTDYAAKVAAGIKKLDASKPGWRDLIDVQTLDLESCSVCVLGQIFGDYHDGRDQLDISSAMAHEMGFNTENSFRELTEAWKEALGENNTLVEKGDVYRDTYGCCAVKVLGTQIITIDGKEVTTYTVVTGSVGRNTGEFTAHAPMSENLEVLRKGDFEESGTYAFRVPKGIPLKKGMFVTNNTGKVYYIRNSSQAVVMADGADTVGISTISLDGLREVKTYTGNKVSVMVGTTSV